MLRPITFRPPNLRALAAFLILATGSLAEAENSVTGGAVKDAQAEKPRAKITVSKETTFVTEPLREDGYVDYVAALNQAASEGVTPENNAAVLLWQALGPADIPEGGRERFFRLLGIRPLPENGDYFVALKKPVERKRFQPDESKPDLFDQQDEAMARPWSQEEFPLIAQWLEKNEKPLELVMEATRRPTYYSPLVGEEESALLIAVLFPAEQKVREVARALAARAMLRTAAGKVEEARPDLMACHRLGRLMSQGPMIIHRAVGGAITTIACQAHAALAHAGNLTGEQARRFLHDLGQLPPIPPFVDKLNVGERYMLLDLASIGAREGPEALASLRDEFPVPRQWLSRFSWRLRPPEVDWDETLRVVNQWCDRVVEVTALPARSERRAAIAKFEHDLEELEKEIRSSIPRITLSSILSDSSRPRGRAIGQIFVVVMMAGVTAASRIDDRDAVQLSLSRTALALAIYRADHGAYPEKLPQLSPKYLPEVPRDLFADGPLRYQRQGSGYLLYSVGINGKDDGGRDRLEEDSLEFPPPDDLVIRAPSKPR